MNFVSTGPIGFSGPGNYPNQRWLRQCTITRTPAFWGYPAASWLPIILSHMVSQVKRRQSQSYKFKEFTKFSNILISIQTLHATHLLKLLDKMCKYEMAPTSIVEDTERTRFCPQTSIPPFQLLWSGGYNNRVISAGPTGKSLVKITGLVRCSRGLHPKLH